VPTGTWGWVAFDAAQVIADQWGDEVDLAQIDAISIWGWGETRLADFTLLGETHGVYSAFGQSLASAQTGDVLSPMAQAAAWARPDSGTALGWQSKLFDAELGLHFNHARWYSPRLGRFTQASPLGGTFEHLYGYGGNSPYGAVDVNGLWSLWNPFTWGDPNPVGQGLWYSINPFSDANRDTFYEIGRELPFIGSIIRVREGDCLGAGIDLILDLFGVRIFKRGADLIGDGWSLFRRSRAGVMHHRIPRQVIGQAPEDLRPLLRGRRGSPNRVHVNERAHRQAHGNSRGPGHYNRQFTDTVNRFRSMHGSFPNAEQYNRIADRLMDHHGLR
jgi:RHS repeat-associated protein